MLRRLGFKVCYADLQVRKLYSLQTLS